MFASLVTKMDALVASGRMIAAELVGEEAEAVGTAGLIQWVKLGMPCISLLGMMRREK